MDNLTNLQAELILTTYENLQTKMVSQTELQLAFDCLPGEHCGENHLAKNKALNQFVITHIEELETMRTTLINNQSDQNEVVEGPFALKAGVKPKAKRKPRRKTKTRAKGRRAKK